ncbi:methyltransferase [Abeliophyllum distichum]|uniref:U6 small nuclear RNA (adenine-(43)-N(6))-methyltransferase n=1 Tax=Abeliophyllum distichum TaxID=126358 RepID=A0ABD1P865_9LAMI
MPSKKKRKRGGERPVIHPRNKYSENPPDFGLLASLHPSFEPYVFYSHDGRPKIDWTDFHATRELTRILLLHDHGFDWWIPDGQLCPTVPNRLNYIHWIEDLLASDLIPCTRADSVVKGFDIGTGANCIYPLLGASLLGWTFVGSDVTDVAIEWANRNVKSNPPMSELIEIRRVDSETKMFDAKELQNGQKDNINSFIDSNNTKRIDMRPPQSFSLSRLSEKKSYHGPPVLVGVIKDGENFDFCMCNPPFFETMEEAGLNPKTSCGGTPEEMVCPGGEEAFITRIIEDSVQLKQTFWWYTSMVGRKSNLNTLTSKLWNVGVTIVKTTEFVQGRTSRWGLAWSFVPPSRKMIFSHVTEKNNLSFMLEGLQRQYSAFHVLQSVESFLCSSGASCKLNAATFNIDITASKNHCDKILKSETQNKNEAARCKNELERSNASNDNNCQSDVLWFRISVFQQIPGTLLVRATLQQKESSISGLFSLIFQQLELFLKNKFCTERVLADGSCSNPRR